jgi:tripartite ATP-independent transporter DctM subunit
MTDTAAVLPPVEGVSLEEQPTRTDAWLLKRVVDTAAYLLLSVALWGELGVVITNVVLRKWFSDALLWEPEVSQLALALLAFVGGAVAYGQRSDLAITVLAHALPERWANRLAELSETVVAAAGVAMACVSIEVIQADRRIRTPVLQFSESWILVPFTIGMALFAFYATCRLVDRVRTPGAVLRVAAIVAAIAGLTEAIRARVPLLPESWITWTLALTFFVLLVIGVPIAFALLGTAAFVIPAANLTMPDIVPQTMLDSTGNFIFVAVPFFVLAGLMLTNSGVSNAIAHWIGTLVGKLPGGFLQVIVVSMYLFSGLSGSKLADTLAVGQPLGDMLERYGYSREEGAGVLTASAVMGETVPPSLAILILGSVTSLSVGTLFSAGLLPAGVLAVCLMALIFVRAKRGPKQVAPPTSPAAIARATVLALPGLGLPVLLIGGIIAGIATPTEVSSFAVVYGLLLIFVYRGGVTMFWSTMRAALTTGGLVLFVLTSASAFSWLLTFDRIPQDVADAATRTSSHPWVFVLVSIVLLVFFGAVLEGAAALIVLAPILLPVAMSLGINPLQYGLVLIIAMGFGTHLPLVGVGFYVACTAMKASVNRSIRPTFVYLGVLLIGLLLVAFYEPFTTIVPQWLGQQ